MTTYNYTVSLDAGLSSIQQAIDQISAEILAGEIVNQDITISVADGTYPAFKIPNGILMPLMGTTNRLIIKSAGSYFPVIDFNRSTSDQVIGADLGSANPNITIEGLKFQFFAVGIKGSLNSHNPKISKCIVSNCRNVGIFIDQCSNSQVIQSVITNGDFGIVARLCKNIALVHNTIFLNGSISTNSGTAVSAIWCQLANDYGSGLTDTGKLHLIGNIAWNTAGTTLSLFSEDVERQNAIVSNYNNFVVGQADRFISIEDRSFSTSPSTPSRLFIPSLVSWKTRGFDLNSKSEDPKFIAPIRNSSGRTKHSINLTLLPDSPVKGMVPSFYSNAQATLQWLPSYVSSADLSTDILNNSRLNSGTAAGANDAASSASFFGSDVLVVPVESGNILDCGADPILDVITKNYDLWYPKYRIGYFYAYDREYYLYATKGFSYIGQLAVTKFNLPFRVNNNFPIKLHVNGSKVNPLNYLDVVGSTAYLYHSDLNIINGNEEVEIEYGISRINKETSSITYTSTISIFKIKEGETRYFLPSEYVARGPVVITDDLAYPTNSDLICNREFAVTWDPQFQLAEIKFHKNNNLVQNSQFDYYVGEPPLSWASSGATVVVGSGLKQAVAGSNWCEINPSGYISQEFPITSGSSVFSWYSYGTGVLSGNAEIKFYDGFNRDLGYLVNKQFNVEGDWQRYFISIGTGTQLSTTNILEDYTTIPIGDINVPPNSTKAQIRISSFGTGKLLIDATQYEVGSVPSYYSRVPYGNEMTVEYEINPDENFIDFKQCMSSTVTTQNEGFLYIPEIPASVYNGPNDAVITTLNEFRWPEGRKYHLPWARIAGKDKLRKRTLSTFHAYPQKIGHVSSIVFSTPNLKDIELIPDNVVTSQGDENGVTFTLNAADVNGNPLSDAVYQCTISDFSLRFPGWLHKKVLGAKQQLGQGIYGRLDNGGNAVVTWVPPPKENFAVVTQVPTPTSTAQNGQSISFIRTKYPVNLDFNGNVSILDNNNNLLNKNFDNIQGYYNPVYSKNQSVITTEYPIKLGSVSVYVGNDMLSEVFVSTPDSDQFYVDYENGTIYLKGRRTNIFIEYVPLYVFINQSDLYKVIIYHDKVFGSYNNSITLYYDSFVKLTVDIQDYSNSKIVTKNFDLVALNPLSQSKISINKFSLEF